MKLFIWLCPTYGCGGMHDPAYEGSILYVVADSVEDAKKEANHTVYREYDKGVLCGVGALVITRDPDVIRELPCAELVEWVD